MRILFCNYEYPPLGGGGGVINALLAQELATRHGVTVLTSQAAGLPGERIEQGVRVIRVPIVFRKQEAVASFLSMLAFIPSAISAGKKLLQATPYDVLNTFFVLPTGPVGNALSRAAATPNVLTLLGGDIYDPSKFMSPHRHPLLRAWVRRLLKRADMVVADSQNVLANAQRFYTPDLKGVVIPLGIQRPRAKAAVRGRYGCQDDDLLLVTVGRLIARKAIPQLIAMMSRLRQRNVRLLIMGTGPDEPSLKKAVAQYQLEKHILFLGRVEESEKFAVLRMCDLYVSTSQHEGFGLVFLEAMASGLPIVCYDDGGQTDFLRDGETGFLVPLNNLELFSDRCERLLDDPILREEMGHNNSERVEEFYIDRCALRYEKTFTDQTPATSNHMTLGHSAGRFQTIPSPLPGGRRINPVPEDFTP